MRYLLCEVHSYFDAEFDGTLCKVKRVLHISNSIEEAEDAYNLFDPCRYNDYDTKVRMVPEDKLDSTFR